MNNKSENNLNRDKPLSAKELAKKFNMKPLSESDYKRNVFLANLSARRGK